MEPPLRNASYLPTVKCSSCAADIDLSAVADHVCSTPLPGQDDTTSHVEQTAALSSIAADMEPAHNYPPPPINQQSYDRPPIEPARRKANRPVLAKLDSSVTSRSGLRPSEAASIAHDLGLPSPLSAGASGHRSPRSRSRSRKASAHRPSSPEVLISQDCAFPAFPMKPKKTQSEKEVRIPKPRSASRSTTNSRPRQHSATHSTSSSVYSANSSRAKSRISNMSSSQQSKQGTIDDAVSLPSTAPSSPRQSLQSPLSRQESVDHAQLLPALVPSHSNTTSEPNSTASTMPPTPSWPLEPGDIPPRILQSPNADVGWTPTESTILEEQSPEGEPFEQDHKTDKNQDPMPNSILLPEQLRDSTQMFDNPPRESLYKSKRPAPLLNVSRRATDDPAMPLSARSPPSAQTSGGGLARTLTNLFGRKRSQSSTSRPTHLAPIDSPRMRALAPEPPERPHRGEGLWDTDEPMENLTSTWSPPHSARDETTLETAAEPDLNHMPVERDVAPDKIEVAKSPTGVLGFDFKFEDQESETPIASNESPDMTREHEMYSSESFDTKTSESEPFESDMRRASIDSASSYGSIGFSNRTTSSKSSAPMSEEAKHNRYTVTEYEQSSTTTTEITVPWRPKLDDLVPDSPTDPLYHGGKLSPVPESDAQQSQVEDNKTPLEQMDNIPVPDIIPEDTPRTTRPVTPAGVRGRCRGCSNAIVSGQKSVASADGRLTGKYHKECFVCRTCKEAFATADFYVFNDQPYCAHHYHTLNNTLCTGCGKGIEGEYQETFDVAGSSSKKFHSKCLQCFTCKIQLNEDYFELQGRVYCERDAFRAANAPRRPNDTVPARPSPLVREYISSGEPGLKGRFPERRTTRLIMT